MPGVFQFLAGQPFVLLFLAVALGYAVGAIAVRRVSLGPTVGTILVSVALATWAFAMHEVPFQFPALLGTLFFNLFVFAVGLRIGPQFFAGLERDGKRFVVVAVLVASIAPAIAVGYGVLVHLPPGVISGMLAGSSTALPALGAAQSAVAGGATHGAAGGVSEVSTALSASFVITYLMGMVGLIAFVRVTPRLFRVDARASARALTDELEHGTPVALPGSARQFEPGYLPFDVRAYRLEGDELAGKRLSELSRRYPGGTVEKVRRDGVVFVPTKDTRLQRGDVIAVEARVAAHLAVGATIGPEVDDHEVRDVRLETVQVVVPKLFASRTLTEIVSAEGFGVIPVAVFRMGEVLPMSSKLELKPGDVLRVTGSTEHIAALEKVAGAVVRASVSTDIATLSVGLALGAAIGAIRVPLFGVELTIGPAGGLLLAGIAVGTLRARNPSWGPFPEPARLLVEDLGLNVFVAVVGLGAGPGIAQAVNTGQIGTLTVGALLVGLLPPLLVWAVGLYGFKMNPAVLLGALSGARQNSAAMRAAEEDCESDAPAIGFPVPYALSTILMTVFAYIVMLLVG